MSGIIPPWPPSDPTEPQPFDQRGACWPNGPCAQKLPTRLEVICTRTGGGIDPDWGAIKTGRVFLIYPPECSKRIATYYTSGPQIVMPGWITIEYVEDNPTDWWLRYHDTVIEFPSSVYHVDTTFWAGPSGCGTDWVGPLETVVGPTPEPEFVTIRWLNWWNLSTYPW